VSGGRVYTMGNRHDQDTVWCWDTKSGRAIWKHTYAAKLGAVYYEGGPGSTPTVSGNTVFTISKWGDVFCFERATGKIVWHTDLRKEGIQTNRWGFAGSPLVRGKLVLLNAGSAGTALDVATGRIIWSNGTNATGYASPVTYRFAGGDAVLIFAAKHLVALELA